MCSLGIHIFRASAEGGIFRASAGGGRILCCLNVLSKGLRSGDQVWGNSESPQFLNVSKGLTLPREACR